MPTMHPCSEPCRSIEVDVPEASSIMLWCPDDRVFVEIFMVASGPAMYLWQAQRTGMGHSGLLMHPSAFKAK